MNSEQISSTTAPKVYECTEEGCGKKFTRLYSLRRHLLSHSGVRKHKCDVCGKRFGLRQCLKEHSYIHTGEKPYVCNFPGCDKRFRQTGKLSLHKKVHLKEIQLAKERAEAQTVATAPTEKAPSTAAFSHSHMHPQAFGAGPVGFYAQTPIHFETPSSRKSGENVELMSDCVSSFHLQSFLSQSNLPLPKALVMERFFQPNNQFYGYRGYGYGMNHSTYFQNSLAMNKCKIVQQ